MKRFCSILLAVSSVGLLWVNQALAEERPRYGGTLRIAVKEAPASFDPATLASTGPAGLSSLVFETLVTLDDRGRPQPLLATSWQSDPGNQRWRFSLRSGVSFHDGVPLDSNAVAASLRAANPGWKIMPAGDSVWIETDSPDAALPAEIALPRNGISRLSGEKITGTGPFTIALWNSANGSSANHITLNTNEQYWGGRPFLDSIEIDFGKDYQAQSVLFDLGKADVIQVAPEYIHRAQARSDDRAVLSSQPSELLALMFTAEPRSDGSPHARNALALSIDTTTICNVVLQGGGEPSAALLPNWLSGYAFLFPGPNRERALDERAEANRIPSSTLGYDASDPVSRVIAERILLNARDAGISLQMTSSSTSDLKLVRIPLAALDPYVAVSELARTLQLPQPKFANATANVNDPYSIESALMKSRRIIPLLHLRRAIALRSNVHGWNVFPLGEWHIENVWMSNASISNVSISNVSISNVSIPNASLTNPSLPQEKQKP